MASGYRNTYNNLRDSTTPALMCYKCLGTAAVSMAALSYFGYLGGGANINDPSSLLMPFAILVASDIVVDFSVTQFNLK